LKFFLVLTLLLSGCDQLPFEISMKGDGDGDGGESSSDGGSSGDGTSSEASASSEELVGETLEIGETHVATPKGGIAGLVRPGALSKKPPEPAVALGRGQCSDFSDGGPLAGPGCITAKLECDQTIYGHTRGGVENYNTRFYEQYFCTPATTQHDGGDERVYFFEPPEGRHRIWFTLDTPCADLDLAVIAVSDDDACPMSGDDISDCEMWPKDGHTREVVDVPSTGTWVFYAVVEGKGDEEGAFALTVQCGEWM